MMIGRLVSLAVASRELALVPALLLSSGCFLIPAPRPPKLPEAPRTRVQPIEEVVNTRAVINFHTRFRISNPTAKTFAVFDFSNPAEAVSHGAGALVADMLTISLGQRGIRPVERQYLQRLEQEQSIVERSKNLTAEEKRRLIGQIAKADYLILGVVTEFNSSNRDVPVPMFIPEDERDRYSRDYNDYMSRFEQYKQDLQAWNTIQLRPMSEPPEPKALPIDRQEEAAAQRTRNQLATVANIGVTMRVLDVTTGEVVWVGQGSKRHLQLQQGLQILTGELIDSLLK
jgi:curli biogenesis system outer membrane secretion channel CsgG